MLEQAQPDLCLARCKLLLKEEIFSIPRQGTLVMHPGICPEYRNAHGCIWALANDDVDRVGMSLLRIDKGVDTGPRSPGISAAITTNATNRTSSFSFGRSSTISTRWRRNLSRQ